jgi:hypothetical protein
MTETRTTTQPGAEAPSGHVSAREAFADAQGAHADAKAAVDRLTAAAAAGDPSVTGAQLAAARADVELAALRLANAEAQVEAEGEAERQAANEAAANRYVVERDAAAADFRAAADQVRAALGSLVAAARRHDLAVARAIADAEATSRPGAPDRLRGPAGSPYTQVTIDHRPLPGKVTLRPWVTRLYMEAIGQPLNTDPNLVPQEA